MGFSKIMGVLPVDEVNMTIARNLAVDHPQTINMHLYVPDFLCQVGLAYLGGHLFSEGAHPPGSLTRFQHAV